MLCCSDTAVYPMYEILGWYTVGTEATEADLGIQRQVGGGVHSVTHAVAEQRT